MPILLYCVGGLAVAIGAAMIGLGIPNNEFGIGNTLIVAGTTACAGGLIVAALGVAVGQLQRIADALATRAPIRSSRPFDTFDPAAAARPPAAPARVPFPPKTKPEFRPEVPPEGGLRDAMARGAYIEPVPPAEPAAAPTLPNPDEPPVTVADEAYLSPMHPAAPPYARGDEGGHDDSPLPPRKSNTYFDAMWPVEPKSAEQKPAEQKPAEPNVSEFQWSDVRRSEPTPVDARPGAKPPVFSDPSEPVAEKELEEHEGTEEADAPRSVAILKSGVVDGMGYTLYVDGSIEAELPQGTLRFASINELRSHLEKTS